MLTYWTTSSSLIGRLLVRKSFLVGSNSTSTLVRVVPLSRLHSNWRMPCSQWTRTDKIGGWKNGKGIDPWDSQTCVSALRILKMLVMRLLTITKEKFTVTIEQFLTRVHSLSVWLNGSTADTNDFLMKLKVKSTFLILVQQWWTNKFSQSWQGNMTLL
jgi:hypothetical protein